MFLISVLRISAIFFRIILAFIIPYLGYHVTVIRINAFCFLNAPLGPLKFNKLPRRLLDHLR